VFAGEYHTAGVDNKAVTIVGQSPSQSHTAPRRFLFADEFGGIRIQQVALGENHWVALGANGKMVRCACCSLARALTHSLSLPPSLPPSLLPSLPLDPPTSLPPSSPSPRLCHNSDLDETRSIFTAGMQQLMKISFFRSSSRV
jgi:hypothetical protein